MAKIGKDDKKVGRMGYQLASGRDVKEVAEMPKSGKDGKGVAWMAKEWPRCQSAKDVNGKEVTRMAKEWPGWVINWQVQGCQWSGINEWVRMGYQFMFL